MKTKSQAAAAGKLGKNWLEWAVFAISCLLVVATITVLAIQLGGRDPESADLGLELGQAETRDGWMSVPLKVTNRGERAVQGVTVRVAATGDEGTSYATCHFDFIPSKGERKGAVSFRADAGEQLDLEAEAIGYSDP